MASNEHLAGKVVVITGAAAGVGRAIALRFAREGAKLGLISRDKTALESLADELRAAGAKDAAVAPLDVSDARPFLLRRIASQASWARSISGSMTRW